MSHDEFTLEPIPDLSSKEVAKIVAEQNDRFRRAAFGLPVPHPAPQGQVLMTPGISARDDAFRIALIHAVMAYEDFNPDCDPHGWHEMGVVEIEGETVWFKIDLYDEAYEYGSSDPTDLRFTRRVLTLLFPSEY